jgi:hypothetical protein
MPRMRARPHASEPRTMSRPRAPKQRMSAPEQRMSAPRASGREVECTVVEGEGEVGRASGVVLSGTTL